MKAYQAVIYAKPGKLLLGGVKLNRSTPFSTIGMAEQWIHASSQQPNYGRYEIREVQSKRPITRKEAHGYRWNPASNREEETMKMVGENRYDPIYVKEFKPRGYTRKVTVLNANTSDAARILAGSGKWTKEQHLALAKSFADSAEIAQTVWGEIADAAAQETFGRPFGMYDYKVSGIGRSEFSESRKDKLRFYAHARGVLNTLSYAHAAAAKVQNRYKYKHNPGASSLYHSAGGGLNRFKARILSQGGNLFADGGFKTKALAKKWLNQYYSHGLLFGRSAFIVDTNTDTIIYEKHYD